MNKHITSIIISLFCISILPIGLLAHEGIPSAQKATVQPEQNRIKAKIAVIYLIDPIDFKKTTLDLVHAAKNSEIHGILLVINSWGGQCELFYGLHDIIKKITIMKPVVALVVGSALSGGYLVASAAQYIIAHSGAEIGNIGVTHIVQRYREPRITGQIDAKLEVEVFQAGKFKAVGNTYKELSTEDKNYIKERLQKVYEQFLKTIIKNRKVSLENYKDWAEGKWYIAPEALQQKLIDEIGTVFEAEDKMRELISARNQGCLFEKDIEPIFYEDKKDTK